MTSRELPVSLADEGKIDHCASCTSICGYWCCSFADDPLTAGDDTNGVKSGSAIVMYPGEYADAIFAGYDPSNYVVLDHDALGGLQVSTHDRGCCQMAQELHRPLYKSFECQVYPIWPYVDEHGEWRANVALRCPIVQQRLDLSAKKAQVIAKAQALCEGNPTRLAWFQAYRCNGVYAPYEEIYPDECTDVVAG